MERCSSPRPQRPRVQQCSSCLFLPLYLPAAFSYSLAPCLSRACAASPEVSETVERPGMSCKMGQPLGCPLEGANCKESGWAGQGVERPGPPFLEIPEHEAHSISRTKQQHGLGFRDVFQRHTGPARHSAQFPGRKHQSVGAIWVFALSPASSLCLTVTLASLLAEERGLSCHQAHRRGRDIIRVRAACMRARCTRVTLTCCIEPSSHPHTLLPWLCSNPRQRPSSAGSAASVSPRLPGVSAHPRIPVYARQACMYKLVAVKIHKGGTHEYVSAYDGMTR